jgi:poly(hydroxyalkanoate) granule-associated protein
MMDESRYQKLADTALGTIERMLEDVDAEVVDVERAGDVVTLTFASSKKCVVNTQRPTRQIWLAGLGAFSRAQAEGMKVFEGLVKQGEAVETKTRRAATDTAVAARHAAQTKAREMQQMAGGTWDKLEKVFEDRVARALSRLGVHTHTDVERLAARVDALSEAVNELIKASGANPNLRPSSSFERLVKGAVSTATRTPTSAARNATGVVSKAARNAGGAVTTESNTAKRTVRTARKVARAAIK